MREQEKRLFEGPKIIEVDGNEVRPGVLGEVHFDSGEIFVPSFSKQLRLLKNRVRKAYKAWIADPLKDYIAGHEDSEYFAYHRLGRQLSEDEHARMDAEVLESPQGWIGYVVHGLRAKYGSWKQSRFSELVSKYAPVASRYREIEENHPYIVDGVAKLLGLRPFDPEEIKVSISGLIRDYARRGLERAGRIASDIFPVPAYRPAFAEVEA